MSMVPALTPKVIELLGVIVERGGETTNAHLVETCGLSKAQLKRQLSWMEKQDLVNQSHSVHDDRTWVRATATGREALKQARQE